MVSADRGRVGRRGTLAPARMIALLAAWSVLGCGCGYRLGARFPDEIATVAVPTFDNRTFPLRREIEYELTSAVRKEIQSRTRLTLVDSSTADVVLFGTVLFFYELVVAEGRSDEKLESTIRITVELRIEDYRRGTVRQETVEDAEPISIARGETIEVARLRAIGNLAEKIVLKLEAF